MYQRIWVVGLTALLAACGNIADRPSAGTEQQLFPETSIPLADTGAMTNETPQLWFVELSGNPAADGGSLAAIDGEQRTLRGNAQREGIKYQERFAFKSLWNGFSVRASSSEASKFTRLDGVKNIYPVATIPRPETTPFLDPEMATALAMTGADVAQGELGYTGAGIKVAVMDTGIDIDHPDFGGSGVNGTTSFPTARITHGWDFVGSAFNADPSSLAYNPVAVPDANPDDCNGHGTHVAGIVGANGTVKGVAPGVTFGAYRVFGCEGSTTADIMIAAMERALADGMDVLNMSIGSAFQWPQYPTGAAATRMVNKGMVVVASIGNSGANGLYSASSPGLGDKVIGVASFDNSHVRLNAFTISPDNTAIGYTPATAAPLPPTSGTFPMAKTGTPSTTNDACSPLAAGSLTGKVVLIRRGTCTFYVKSLNAQNAGAAAVVLYNNAAGRFSATVAGSPAITIPVVTISDTEGVLINNRIAAGPVDMTWTSQVGSFPNPLGGLISSFSSYGLSPDLTLKPDIGAPGGLIRSTYPLEAGGFATISGTSMASPHVAGAVALLLEAKPNTPSQAVRGILQNSADPKPFSLSPAAGLDHVHRQGAGMLDIDDAILATTKIEPAKLSLGEGTPAPQTLTIENKGNAAVTYDLSFVNAVATGGVITPTFFGSNASVAFSAPSVTVPAGTSASVVATITPTTTADRQYGGYIVFTPQGGGQIYRVPFAGYSGDYQAIQVFTGGFPFLGRLNTCTPVALLRDLDCFGTGNFSVFPAGATYTLANAFNTPNILVHLDHQVRLLRMEAFDAVSGKAWHRVHNQEYVGRNSTSTTFFAFPWDGTTSAGKKTYTVPDGQYVIKVSALKALGDSANPAHWEIWTSPVITIDRP